MDTPPQEAIQPQATAPSTWNQVTPLSRYLAMALFIALPFAGFWVGMQYGAGLQVVAPIETPASTDVGQGEDQSENNRQAGSIISPPASDDLLMHERPVTIDALLSRTPPPEHEDFVESFYGGKYNNHIIKKLENPYAAETGYDSLLLVAGHNYWGTPQCVTPEKCKCGYDYGPCFWFATVKDANSPGKIAFVAVTESMGVIASSSRTSFISPNNVEWITVFGDALVVVTETYNLNVETGANALLKQEKVHSEGP